ncbi:MAG TPA: hypothetical protein VI685_15045 [Candidatus Angelobacter sp.]
MNNRRRTVFRFVVAAILAILLGFISGAMLEFDMPLFVGWLTIPGWYLTAHFPPSTSETLGLFKLILISQGLNAVYYFLVFFLLITAASRLLHRFRRHQQGTKRSEQH